MILINFRYLIFIFHFFTQITKFLQKKKKNIYIKNQQNGRLSYIWFFSIYANKVQFKPADYLMTFLLHFPLEVYDTFF